MLALPLLCWSTGLLLQSVGDNDSYQLMRKPDISTSHIASIKYMN